MVKDHPEKPSEIFEEAFRGGFGGCSMVCECGRVCFDYYNHYDWNQGELEELQKKAADNPKKYVPLDYSCCALCIDGKTFVMGCPCNGARKYEDWIRRHAERLAEFLVGIRKERLDRAEALKLADALENFPTDPDCIKGDWGYPVQ